MDNETASETDEFSHELEAAHAHASSAERLNPIAEDGAAAAAGRSDICGGHGLTMTNTGSYPLVLVNHTVSTRAGSLVGGTVGFGGAVTYRLPPRYALRNETLP